MILQRHRFVQERFAAATEALRVDDSDVLDSLTEPLSESRELAKEMQRQEKAKLLAGGSQTLIR